jgi:hypothetical protein
VGQQYPATDDRFLKHEMNALARSLQVDYSVSAFSGQEFENARTYGLLPTYDDTISADQWHGSIDGTDFLYTKPS